MGQVDGLLLQILVGAILSIGDTFFRLTVKHRDIQYTQLFSSSSHYGHSYFDRPTFYAYNYIADELSEISAIVIAPFVTWVFRITNSASDYPQPIEQLVLVTVLSLIFESVADALRTYMYCKYEFTQTTKWGRFWRHLSSLIHNAWVSRSPHFLIALSLSMFFAANQFYTFFLVQSLCLDPCTDAVSCGSVQWKTRFCESSLLH